MDGRLLTSPIWGTQLAYTPFGGMATIMPSNPNLHTPITFPLSTTFETTTKSTMHTEHSNSGDESDGDSMVEVDDGLYSHDDSSTETLMVDPADRVQQTPAEKKRR